MCEDFMICDDLDITCDSSITDTANCFRLTPLRLDPLNMNDKDASQVKDNNEVKDAPHKLHYASSFDSDGTPWTPSTSTTSDTDMDACFAFDITSNTDQRDSSLTPTLEFEKLTLNCDLKDGHLGVASDYPVVKSPLYQENDIEYCRPKRSSSLKTKRTPPDSPGEKMVRFADAFGLDLETVRTVFNQESPPKIPDSATADLVLDSEDDQATESPFFYCLCFPQPGGNGNFMHRVMQQNVCLENIVVDESVLSGTVRVKSLGFEKRVAVRITFNNWRTVSDIPAHYVADSHDGATDRFSFAIVLPELMQRPGAKAQFAVEYDACQGQVYWDNNVGQNYTIECIYRDNV